MLPTTGRTARDVSPDQAARLFAAECDQAALEVFERHRAAIAAGRVEAAVRVEGGALAAGMFLLRLGASSRPER